MRAIDARPTATAPDDDPWLWLEEVEGARAVAWVTEQNARTLARFGGAVVSADQDALAAIMDRADNIPTVTRRGALLYNFWKDAANPRGLWRRATLASFRTETPDWQVLIDVDALAAAENEDWIWGGAGVRPGTHDRAMIRLSRGGSDAVVLREFDLTTQHFVPGGFALPEAKGDVVWADADTLLLASALGEGQATKSGYARTVRLWRRGQDPLAAPEIFATGADSIGVGAEIDHDNHRGPFVFVERIGFFDVRIWLGGPEGKRVQIPVPTDAWCSAHRDWIVVRPRTPWSIVGTTHQPGTLLGIGFESLLAGGDDFTTLFTPGPRRALSGFHWANGKLVVHALDDLQPEAMVFTPGAWTSVTVPGLPKIGVAGIWRLDAEEHESDGSLLFSVSGPLTPPTLMLTDTALAAPQLLKRAPAVFDAAGLVVTRHDALSPDGTRIPYVQVGPPGETGDAPVHMYGYGGFNVSETPTYRGGIGKLWLERGGTSVTTNLRGGGEFGPEWHESGRREGKARSHDDFAAVASDLVRRGVTRPGRIAAEGGSNGGLLITNMLTRYPECFGALFCTIPLIDMRRYHRLLAGASWIDEYGDPDKPEDWAFLRDISAYHQAVGEIKYPPILLATTRRDDRVHPGHARKMAAKLQSMGQPAWFYELEGGGHGYGRTNRERAFFTALGHSFLRAAIGWNFATKSS